MIGLISIELARTHDARVAEIRVGTEDGVEFRQDRAHVRRNEFAVVPPEGAIHMDMRPSPQFRVRRKGHEVGDLDEGQGFPGDHLAVLELAFLEDHKREPGFELKTAGKRLLRRIAPGEILFVELYMREIVWLYIGDPVTRLDARDYAAVNAHDVARTIEFDVAPDAGREWCTAVNAIACEIEFDAHIGARAPRHGSCAEPANTAPEPGKETIGGAAHAASSKAETTWILPASDGLLASAEFMNSCAAAWLAKDRPPPTAALVSDDATAKLSPLAATLSEKGFF